MTKRAIRESKKGLTWRITELCAMLAGGKIRTELQRVMPGYIENPMPEKDEECLRQLLYDATDLAFPDHLLN